MRKIFQKADKIKKKIITDALVLYMCYRDDRTPFKAKIVSLAAFALAFSPIDIIPDFIPVIGYIDDIIIIPLLIYAAFKLIPDIVISENRIIAETINSHEHPVFRITAVVIVIFWITAILMSILYIFKSGILNAMGN